jgi:hypothetical protein
MEKATQTPGTGGIGGLLAFVARLFAGRRARPEGHALRDIGLESYQPGLAQQMLDERRRHTVGLL